MVFSGRPAEPVPVAASVRELIARRPFTVVWQNELGGLTFEIEAAFGREFVKWTPNSSGINLGREIDRLRWAASYWPVPSVLNQGADDDGSWLVTAGLDGDNAVSDRWKADPQTAVTAIGEGLRALHEKLPVDACPFSWSAEDRVADAQRRAAAGLLDPAAWHPEHQRFDVPTALKLAADVPSIDQLVVCHGDACAPNTLIGSDGKWTGHVDLGSVGVADRWADLAVASWSTQWNYDPGWEDALLHAYGVEPAPRRLAYYRLLWDLGP